MKTAKAHNDQLTGRIEPPSGLQVLRESLTNSRDLLKEIKSLKRAIHAHKWSQQNYEALSECVANGVKGGWYKAHKHTDTPAEEHILEMIESYVMLEISEKFHFE